MHKNIIACIDGSKFSQAVCDAAAWSAQRLNAPLHLLNVSEPLLAEPAEPAETPTERDKHEEIESQLQQLDYQRAQLSRKRGDAILEKSSARIVKAGSVEPRLLQVRGTLSNIVEEMEDDIRLLILGKRGDDTLASGSIGSHIEQIIRNLRRPMLIVMEQFVAPRRVLMAFDGSATTAKGVRLIAESPLFNGIECHVVQVGADTDEHREQLRWAEQTLEEGDIPTITRLLVTNDVDDSLSTYTRDNEIDMVIMGAYSHSRLRQLLWGSNTTKLLSHSSVPVLVLR
ncbi:MAG: universal stress protein [Pseudohongiella sp.]|uniref:universal stress protein n=1 Tax=Pseudohongiella sp. TaxID=1979412 RepID=UPI0034A074EA